jgi:hypothetical protein
MAFPQMGHFTVFIVRPRPKLRAFSGRGYFAGPSDFAGVDPVLGVGEPVDGVDSAGFTGADSAFSAFLYDSLR